MNFGLCGGIHQAFLGTSLQTDNGEILNFGRTDYLADENGETVLVRTVGDRGFKKSLEPFLRVKIGFTF